MPLRVFSGEDVDFGPSGGVVIILYDGDAAFCLCVDGDDSEDGQRHLTHVYLGTQTDDATLLQLADGTGFPFELLASVLDGTYVQPVDVEEFA